jgi:CRP-like cAMP-binding protein
VRPALELLAQRVSLIPGLSPGMLAPLDELPAEPQVIAAGRPVVAAGAKFDSIFLIEAGWVCLHAELEDGTNQVLTFLLPGQFVGLGALAYPTAAWSFTAVSRALLLRFEPQGINALLDHHPQLSKLLMWIALTHFGQMGERLTDIGRRSAYQRTGRFILDLWSCLHDVGLADKDGFELPIGQKLMADAVGLTDVHLNRTLLRLRNDGLISIERDTVRRAIILDPAAAVSKLGFDTTRFRLPGFH